MAFGFWADVFFCDGGIGGQSPDAHRRGRFVCGLTGREERVKESTSLPVRKSKSLQVYKSGSLYVVSRFGQDVRLVGSAVGLVVVMIVWEDGGDGGIASGSDGRLGSERQGNGTQWSGLPRSDMRAAARGAKGGRLRG